jgi:phosphoribosylpyrophosphate synthetase
MTIKLIADNVEIPVKHIRFSDGASTVKLEIPVGLDVGSYISFTVCPTTPCDNVIMELVLVANAFTTNFEEFAGKVIVNLPYLPYARADRVLREAMPYH